jgi:hypothetical protein
MGVSTALELATRVIYTDVVSNFTGTSIGDTHAGTIGYPFETIVLTTKSEQESKPSPTVQNPQELVNTTKRRTCFV